jgi:hypothetical protein
LVAVRIPLRQFSFLNLPEIAPTGKFATMMKKLGIPAVILALVVFFFEGCASSSQKDVVVERPEVGSEGASPNPVPAEHVPAQGILTPWANP